jgi:hypothetical protein
MRLTSAVSRIVRYPGLSRVRKGADLRADQGELYIARRSRNSQLEVTAPSYSAKPGASSPGSVCLLGYAPKDPGSPFVTTRQLASTPLSSLIARSTFGA